MVIFTSEYSNNFFTIPLKVRKEDIEALPPLEKALALHLISKQTGDLLLVDGDGNGQY